MHDFITAGVELSRTHFGKRWTNHSEHCMPQRRAFAHGGLMLRRCHDAICTLTPFNLACEAMWQSDNILPSEICAESLWHPLPHRLACSGEWKWGCVLLMRYAVAVVQQPEPIYSLICPTVGALLSLRGGRQRALSRKCLLYLTLSAVALASRLSARGQTLLEQSILSHAHRKMAKISFCKRKYSLIS